MTEIPKFKVKKPPHLSHHPRPGYSVRGRVWLEKDGELYMGGGREILLERIDKFGSIAAAARSMKLGYRNAWLWVEAANRLAPSPLVEKLTGGVGGGRTRLTDEGREVVERYRQLRAKLEEFVKEVEE